MIKTHGLTHISLSVRDPERSLRFYETVFGVKEYYRDAESIQVLGPGKHEMISLSPRSGRERKAWGEAQRNPRSRVPRISSTRGAGESLSNSRAVARSAGCG